MQNLRNLCQLTRTEIIISDWAELQTLTRPAVDELIILLHNDLLQIEQFQLTPEKNISLEEQLTWQINASLAQPIEQYFYAYQIYLQEENTVQGLFCAAPREKLQDFSKIQNQSVKIYSQDKQFLLYANKLYFWQIDTCLQRLLRYGRLLLAGTALAAALAAPGLWFVRGQLAVRSAALTADKQTLQTRLRQYRAQEQQRHVLRKQKIINQKLSAYLNTFSAALPAQVYFRELNYAQQVCKIQGFCWQDKELKALQKALKTETILKPELAKMNKDSQINFTLQVDLKKALEKELKNVQLASK